MIEIVASIGLYGCYNPYFRTITTNIAGALHTQPYIYIIRLRLMPSAVEGVGAKDYLASIYRYTHSPTESLFKTRTYKFSQYID